jgi:hypothetical protein
VLWIRIRIRKDPHHFGNLDQTASKFYELDQEPDPDPPQFADVKPKCMEYEPILAPLSKI